MTYDLQFVDRIDASPTVRLDLMVAPWGVQVGTDFGMPDFNRARVSTLLRDGEHYPAAAYGNRVVMLVAKIVGVGDDDTAAALQQLYRELDRPSNILRYRPDTSGAVFFRTFRCAPSQVVWDPFEKQVTAAIPAEPFALGLRESLSQVTVYNDPAAPVVSDAFGDAVTDGWGSADSGQAWATTGGSASDYSVSSGAGRHSVGSVNQLRHSMIDAGSTNVDVSTDVTLAISSATGAAASVFVVGRAADTSNYYAAGLLLGPGSGMQVVLYKRVAGALTALPGASAAVGSHTGGNTWRVHLSVSGSTVRAAAWRPGTDPAPGWQVTANDLDLTTGTQVGILSRLESGNTNSLPVLFVYDNVTAVVASSTGSTVGRLAFDVTSPKGDVETPLFATLTGSFHGGDVPSPRGTRRSLFTIRRRGTPSGAPLVLQAETMTQGVDTSTLPNDTTASAAGYSRVTFATVNTLDQSRLSAPVWPPAVSVDLRGTYRVWARVRHSTAADTFKLQLKWGAASAVFTNDAVTVPIGGSSGPAWMYIDLGTIQLPPGSDPVVDGYSGAELTPAQVLLMLAATRTGTGTLDIDCLLFLPADDRTLLIDWTYGSPTNWVLDGRRTAVYGRNASGQVAPSGAPSLAGGAPMLSPGQTNRVYFVRDVGSGAGSTQLLGSGDDVTATTTIAPYYWPRYLYVAPVAS